MKALKYLNQYLWKYKWYLILGTVFTIISNLFGIIPAQLVRYALDLVIETLDLYYLFKGASLQNEMYDIFAFSILLYGLLILLMALLKGIFLFLVRQTIIVMSRHIEFDLKNDIYSHYQTLPASFFRRHNTGDLMARISEDVSNVRMYVGPALMYGINLIVLFFLVISYMLSVSTKLTLYVLLPLPVLSVSVYIVNSMIMERSQAIQKQLSGLSTYVQEAFSGIRVIKSFVQENHSFSNFRKEAEDFKEKSLSLTKVDAFFYPIILLLIGLSNILVIYIGGNEIINGNLTPGNITEFILYVNMLTWPVMALGWTTSQIQRAASSQNRINEFLDEKTTLTSEKNLIKPLEGAISFRNVGFVYPDSGIQALHHFDLEVKQGESVAILGTTGSGKSTLAHLMCRLYDPTEGEILIDHIPLKDYDVHAYRRQIGYVPQDVFLFSDTIENNVRFGTADMPFDSIEQAVKDADLYNNVKDFPQGYETMLGERGITLSGGQKQRLSIARAIARDPKILVLDDCLSAVDTNTENIILNNMKRIMDQRTSVIISHRVSSAKLADKIVVLDEGKIVEQGTHVELMALNGAYKELYEKQLVAEEV
ncbi:ABC transporter ATP-binding protein [Dyadobacter bucti]|uniref:ABC transporter ATP-binding protein n=1 Tax=Dyadobacter bucti TaxID=2572203 RepID=UPI001109DE6E|nr:ABC transporter ATP-binding protein [Dyadobacter bucti]